jgi:DNA-directed RNA polymerase specialized sigma24 family protein
MSHAEIASAMKLPLGTVKTYIDRARRLLHKSLSEGNV